MKETDRIHFVQMPKLKPCPFCGNTDEQTIVLKWRIYDGTCEELRGNRYWWVECFDCDARTGDQWDGDSEHMGFTKEDGFHNGGDVAVYMWNMRK